MQTPSSPASSLSSSDTSGRHATAGGGNNSTRDFSIRSCKNMTSRITNLAVNEAFISLARLGVEWRMCSFGIGQRMDSWLFDFQLFPDERDSEDSEDVKQEGTSSGSSICLYLPTAGESNQGISIDMFDDSGRLLERNLLRDLDAVEPVNSSDNEREFCLRTKSGNLLDRRRTCCCLHRDELVHIVTEFRKALCLRNNAVSAGVNTMADTASLLEYISDACLSEMVFVHQGIVDTVRGEGMFRDSIKCGGTLLLVLTLNRLLAFPARVGETNESHPYLLLPLCADVEVHCSEDGGGYFAVVLPSAKGTLQFRCPSVVSRNVWMRSFEHVYSQRGLGSPLVAASFNSNRRTPSSIFSRLFGAAFSNRGSNAAPDDVSTTTTTTMQSSSTRDGIISELTDDSGSDKSKEADGPAAAATSQSTLDTKKQAISSHLRKMQVIQSSGSFQRLQVPTDQRHLRNQSNFFVYIYNRFHHQAVLLKTAVPSAEAWMSMSKVFHSKRGRTVRELDTALEAYEAAVHNCIAFQRHCLILCKDVGVQPSQALVQFSFPGFDEHSFSLEHYATIEAHKLVAAAGAGEAYSEEQWHGALNSRTSVAKEIMQSTTDINHLYEANEADKARAIAEHSNETLLQLLCITEFCAKFAEQLSDRKLKRFSWKNVLKHSIKEDQNRDRLNRMGPIEFHFNPSAKRIHDIGLLKNGRSTASAEPASDTTSTSPIKVIYVCTSLHYLHVLEFLMSHRLGRLQIVQAATEAWADKQDRAKKKRGKRFVSMRALAMSSKHEIQEIEALLNELPSLQSLAPTMHSERRHLSTYSPGPASGNCSPESSGKEQFKEMRRLANDKIRDSITANGTPH